MRTITIYTDGASRGNPGKAASAWLLLDRTDVLESNARIIGVETNNVAEYTAVISALTAVKKFCVPAETTLEIISDSELMINQLLKKYRVLAPKLKDLYAEVQSKEKEFATISYTYSPRENPYIGACDWLCNHTLDLATTPKPVAPPAEPMTITCTPVGTVHSPYKTTADAPRHAREATQQTNITILPPYVDAIDGLSAGDHVYILCWFHLSDRSILKVKPHKSTAVSLRGVFSTRAPVRPNPISLSLVRIDAIDGCTLTVTGLEAIDGTPVLDIKPFYKDNDLP